MADAADKKSLSAFSNEVEYKTVTFDFDEDGGAIGVYDMLEFAHAAVIHQAYVKIEDDFTSGGAATIEIGVKGGDTDAILTASLPTGAPSVVDGDAASERLYLASGAILSLEVKVAALTAGKCTLVVEASKY